MATMNELDELVALERAVAKMRELGVSRYKTLQLEVDLGPPPPKEEQPDERERGRERVGRDGLTPSQQVELYGRVIDEESHD